MKALAAVLLAMSCASTPAMPTVEELRLTSRIFANTRTIRVLLPPHYSETKRSYPVLYLNDGVTVFKRTAIDVASLRDIPPIIIVGIDNGGSTDTTKNPGFDRAMEYLPYPDAGFEPGHSYAAETPAPRGALYPDFLVGEVMPLVAAHYRVSHRPADTVIGGSSYGGVAALYAAMKHPELFGGLLLESTPLWIGPNRQLLNEARRTTRWPARVYLGIGSAESTDAGINSEGLADLEALKAAIESTSTVKLVIEPNASHSPAAWRRRLPDALRFLFK